MKIKSASCTISAVSPAQYPGTGYPEIAMVGRSNVGKSSLINSLCLRRSLARTSATPGKTQTINFFAVNEQLFLVDLPGYGYAERSKGRHREWGEFVTGYLRGGKMLALIMHLLDLRHEPMKNDKNASEWLLRLGVPYVVIGTKADKISRGRRSAHISAIRKGLALPSGVECLVYSSETGEGREELWRYVSMVISEEKNSREDIG